MSPAQKTKHVTERVSVKPSVLIISGLDPSGDAGFLADVRTASFLGCRPVGVVSAMTVQNRSRFVKQSAISHNLIKDQLRTVLEEERPKAVKIGMLGNKDNIDAIVDILREYTLPNVVLDPVLRSSTGGWLLPERDMPSLRDRLIPQTLIITPNAVEARELSGSIIIDRESAELATKKLAELGVPGIALKGGHIEGDPVDTFNFMGEIDQIAEKRLEGDFHGTGCLFSTALACFLALGEQPVRSFRRAHRFVRWMMERHQGYWVFPGRAK